MTTLTIIERSFALDDIAIRAGGSGRTVVAYAAMFDQPYEVYDGEGHYYEQIHRRGFDDELKRGATAACLFNHGFLTGTTLPSERFSLPLGRPEEVRADGRGLLTVTEYAKTPLADEVLELIRTGAVTGQSFRGAIYASRPGPRRDDGIRSIERMRLGLRDYGPTVMPVNREAVIVGIRSQVLLEQLRDLTDEERAELLAQLSAAPTAPTVDTVPPDGPTDPTDAPPAPVAETPPAGPSLELLEAEQAQRRRRYELEN